VPGDTIERPDDLRAGLIRRQGLRPCFVTSGTNTRITQRARMASPIGFATENRPALRKYHDFASHSSCTNRRNTGRRGRAALAAFMRRASVRLARQPRALQEEQRESRITLAGIWNTPTEN
jgi:hypothetical protein